MTGRTPLPPEPFFLDRPDGSRRFCLLHRPAGAQVAGCVLYLHPFAEEMNKARRMAALQSRAFAAAGLAVLQIDLLGCGDSSGDFGDASWAAWVDDGVAACQWLRQQYADAPPWLWGLRAGTLLALDVYRQLQTPAHLLFWQATPSGKQQLQQFLRLKRAAAIAGSDTDSAPPSSPRALLDRGESVEVGGYRLAPALASGLEGATLTPLPAPLPGTRLLWVELGDDTEPAPASAKTLQAWVEAGFRPEVHVVAGPPFWQTVEVEEAPRFIATSTAAVLGVGNSP